MDSEIINNYSPVIVDSNIGERMHCEIIINVVLI
jgi:hypothetical protein